MVDDEGVMEMQDAQIELLGAQLAEARADFKRVNDGAVELQIQLLQMQKETAKAQEQSRRGKKWLDDANAKLRVATEALERILAFHSHNQNCIISMDDCSYTSQEAVSYEALAKLKGDQIEKVVMRYCGHCGRGEPVSPDTRPLYTTVSLSPEFLKLAKEDESAFVAAINQMMKDSADRMWKSLGYSEKIPTKGDQK